MHMHAPACPLLLLPKLWTASPSGRGKATADAPCACMTILSRPAHHLPPLPSEPHGAWPGCASALHGSPHLLGGPLPHAGGGVLAACLAVPCLPARLPAVSRVPGHGKLSRRRSGPRGPTSPFPPSPATDTLSCFAPCRMAPCRMALHACRRAWCRRWRMRFRYEPTSPSPSPPSPSPSSWSSGGAPASVAAARCAHHLLAAASLLRHTPTRLTVSAPRLR